MGSSNKGVLFLSVLASLVVLVINYEPLSYIAANYLALGILVGPLLCLMLFGFNFKVLRYLFAVGLTVFGGAYLLLTFIGIFDQALGMAEGYLMEAGTILIWMIEFLLIASETVNQWVESSKITAIIVGVAVCVIPLLSALLVQWLFAVAMIPLKIVLGLGTIVAILIYKGLIIAVEEA